MQENTHTEKETLTGFVPNHLHLLVRGHIQHPPKEEEVLNQWLKDLVERVRMEVVAGPTSVYVNEPGNEGITGTVTLATSHAAIHVWDAKDPAFFQFDIYSCSQFSADEVLDHFDQFGLISCEWMYIDRNNGLKVVLEGKR
jgi:S-adenosylmethionine/arginine decarboxylase-like enzyme